MAHSDVDGLVLAVPRRQRSRPTAASSRKAGKVWREYGALGAYFECLVDHVQEGQ